ncbi:MAG TPA: UbiA prenyltransferase family protein [Bryobacteraceae bacterium]|nr:UbiA prenyltransferase family protein [Bryobacteraceae bacterium]
MQAVKDTEGGAFPLAAKPTLMGHFRIARADHWVKNVFVLPGVVVALSMDHAAIHTFSWVQFIIGMLAICFTTSSNYVINEVLDAPFDRKHPTKCKRPVPSGQVSIPLAYIQWLGLFGIGLALGWRVSLPFAATLVVLWVMGCFYNIPPARTKDVPYLDVLSESVNNPLRMLAGWYLTGSQVIPSASLLMSYWMVGCYFMALKRFAEFHEIANQTSAAAYRKSFAYYNDQRLLISIMFYAANSMLFFGAFIVRYRLELILAFPLVALVMANYLSLSFRQDSSVQAPEKLYKEPTLMVSVTVCTAVMIFLLFVNVPLVHNLFPPSPIDR